MASRKGSEHRFSGTRLGARFSLTMSVVLALVMLAAGAFLYDRMVKAAQDVQERSFVEAVKLRGRMLDVTWPAVLDVFARRPDLWD